MYSPTSSFDNSEAAALDDRYMSPMEFESQSGFAYAGVIETGCWRRREFERESS
jgi:hypothetical protein